MKVDFKNGNGMKRNGIHDHGITEHSIRGNGIMDNGIKSNEYRLSYNQAVHQTGPSFSAAHVAGW